MDTRFPPRSPRSDSAIEATHTVTRSSRFFAGALALLGALALSSTAFADPPQLPAPGKTKIIVKIDTHKVAIDTTSDDDDDEDAAPPAKSVKPSTKKDDKADKAEKEKAAKEAAEKEKAEKEAADKAAKEAKAAADEKVKKGVVTIERAGTVLGIGSSAEARLRASGPR